MSDNTVTTKNDVAPTPSSEPSTPTVAEQIKHEYINSPISPQALARKYKVEVDEVLVAIGETDLLEVQIVGDQVDSAGPGVALNHGTSQKVHYSKD